MFGSISLWCFLPVILLTNGLPTSLNDEETKLAPKITYSKETVVNDGESIQLDCAVEGVDLTGVDPFYVKWNKIVTSEDGAEKILQISSNENLLIISEKIEVVHPPNTYQYSLKVPKAGEGDSGKYRCTVDFGEDQKIDADVDVLIRKPAYFDDDIHKTIRVSEGDAISIDCQPGGSPKPDVYWERIGEDLPYYGGKFIKTNQFDLPQIHRSHEGQYLCYADNGLAEPVSSQIILEVDYKPSVEIANKEIFKSVYEQAKLECKAEGNPVPNLVWMKGSNPVQSSANYRVETAIDKDKRHASSSLTIYELQVEDFTKYSCAAVSSMGTAEDQVDLKLKSPPVITKQSRGEKIFEIEPVYDKARGDIPVVLECEAGGSPTPTYRWNKDGKNLEWESDIRMSLEYDTGNLLIKNPRASDSGKYQCLAYNELGMAASDTMILSNSTEIQFKHDIPGEVEFEAELGRPFRLECPDATGHPKPDLVWMKEKRVQGGLELNYLTSGRSVLDNDGNLWISHVTEEDDTEKNDFKFVCLAFSDLYPTDISLAKTVTLKTIAPQDGRDNLNNDFINIEPFQLYTSPEKVSFRNDKENSLWCIYGGEPSPTVYWERTDGKVLDPARLFVKNKGQTLVFKETSLEDAGEYECIADNLVSSSQRHKVNMEVDIVPKFARSLEEQAQIVKEGTSVTFSCGVLESKEKDPPEYQWFYNGRPISEVDGSKRKFDGPNFIISSATKVDIGNYACRASNKIGYAYGQTTLNVIPNPPLAGQRVSPNTLDNIKGLEQDLGTLKTEVKKLTDLVEKQISEPPLHPKMEEVLRQMTNFLTSQNKKTQSE